MNRNYDDLNQEYEHHNPFPSDCNHLGISKHTQTLEENRFSGSTHKVYLKVTINTLSSLFNKDKRTIQRWIEQNKLDPSNLLDIINKFNNKHLLDNRRKEKVDVPPSGARNVYTLKKEKQKEFGKS